MPSESLVVRGRVHTLEPLRPRAEAVLVRAGRVAAVGSFDEVRRLAPGAELLDAGEGAVLPGLVDAHGHLLSLGQALSSVRLEQARSMDDVVAACRAAAARRPAGWLLGRGWDQTAWTTGDRLPDASALDAAFPERPVLLWRVDGHAALANAAALRLAGVGPVTADPPGGALVRDARGRPTGLLLDMAAEPVRRAVPAPTPAEVEETLLAALRHLRALGLTGVHDAGVDAATHDALRRLAASGRLPLRVYAMIDLSLAESAELLERDPLEGAWYALRAAKLFADGALGSRGAHLFEPYDDEPGNRGLAVQDDALLLDLSRRAARRGYQVAVHAIGDRANARVLDLFERLRAEGMPLARPRIEHAQVVRPADIARFRALGAVASMQPVHATSDLRYAGRRLGERRLAGAYAWRSFLEAGVPLCFGSDFPVEDADPRAGLHAATTRTDARGEPAGGWRPQERLSGPAALEAFTAGAAYAAFREADQGRLAPGFAADLTVLDRDPLEDGSSWLDAGVRAVVVGGRNG